MQADRPGRRRSDRRRPRPAGWPGAGRNSSISAALHFAVQPSAIAASTSDLGSLAGRPMQLGAKLRPRVRLRREARRQRRRLLDHRIGRRRTPESCRDARDRERPPARAPPRRRAVRRTPPCCSFCSSSRSLGSSNGGEVVEHAPPPSRRIARARETARGSSWPRARSASAALRRSRGARPCPISSPAFMCGLADVSGLLAAQRRRHAELIGAGAGRKIRRVAARAPRAAAAPRSCPRSS